MYWTSVSFQNQLEKSCWGTIAYVTQALLLDVRALGEVKERVSNGSAMAPKSAVTVTEEDYAPEAFNAKGVMQALHQGTHGRPFLTVPS
jgi:hypothetical protein